MHNKAIYPGTFDPVTNGHLDLIERGAKMFQHVVIGVANNPSKKPLFNLDERVALAKQVTSHLPNVVVVGFSGLLIDFAKDNQATILIRGLRAVSDFEYEFQLVGMNRAMNDSIETTFLMAEAKHQAIASRLVKEIARLGGDVSKFVTPGVETALKEKFKHKA